MRVLLDHLDAWRDEQIDFLARLVDHDSGTDDALTSTVSAPCSPSRLRASAST